MEKVLTNSQMRAADEYTINKQGIPSRTLMRRAGEAIADEVLSALKRNGALSVLVVCGTGNNGGDGYVCAQKLTKKGVDVSVYAIGGKLSDDCDREKNNYTGKFTEKIEGGIIVDCIFGTGLSREITGLYAEIVNCINRASAFVVSADIPSGINGDNGIVMGCAVKADMTVAIAEYKLGMFLNDGIDYCGEIVKKDIGITVPEGNYTQLPSHRDISLFYPERRRNSHKGTYGSANIIAGSDCYIGAAALSTAAALKSGCGYVKLITSEKVKFAIAPVYPQAIYLDNIDLSSSAIAIGMGCGISVALYNKIKFILDRFNGTLIIDADGLNSLSEYGVEILKNSHCKVIITPHVKEFSRLTGISVTDILNNPLKIASEFSEKYGVIVLLKGAASIISDGKKNYIVKRGTTSLAKGGSGDMLSGYMCGTAARGTEAFDAAVCAAYTMGVAAEFASAENTDYCSTAEEVLKNLPNAVKSLTT